ncbi:MAG: lysophospholipid acyltransferase family protein [Hydrotalea sp.]|nr:lysophospholipid acyltransferase family protein [Hydrotalea sp.]
MAAVRQYSYYVFAVVWTLLLGLIFSPLYIIKKQYWVYLLSKWWEGGLLWALRHIVGLSYHVTGRDHLAKPPYVLAMKHQSMFETMLLSVEFYNPCIILKKELLAVPIVGGFLKAAENIAIDRAAGAAAMLTIIKSMKKQLAKKRVLVIFPEGTRMKVGKTRPYQPGVYMMARLGAPVYPVAVNTGCFWNKDYMKKGRAEVAILPAMPSGLTKEDFLKELQQRIETKTRALEKNT